MWKIPQTSWFKKLRPRKVSLARKEIPFVDFQTCYPKQKQIKDGLIRAVTPYTTSDLNRDSLSVGKIQPFVGRCIKQLSMKKDSMGGRTDLGRVVRHRGGGRKKRIRLIDFKRGRKDIWATVLRIEIDPNRNAYLALIQYDDGVLSYIIASQTVTPGRRIIASENAEVLPGNCLPLRKIPVNTIIHSIESIPGAGGKYIRSAGVMGKVLSVDSQFSTIELPSSGIRKFPLGSWATIGGVSKGAGPRSYIKAGEKRQMGFRPHVRGTSMHKHKHPHGGDSSSRRFEHRPAKTKFGLPAYNYKTRCELKPLGLVVARRLTKAVTNKSAYVRPKRRETKQF